MSITAEYRVAVDIPEKVWRAFGSDPKFIQDRTDACHGNLRAGTTGLTQWEAWAVFDTRQKAEDCRRRLMDVMYKWAAKLL
jgi:hypothetical protein